MKIPDKIQKILKEEKYHQLATCSKTGIPNVCTVGAIDILDDETIIIIDNYFRKTKENFLENPAVAILLRMDRECYQIKGTSEYKQEGEVYQNARKWMKSKGDHYPAKGVLVIKVNACFNSMSGPEAGKAIRSK